MDRPVRSAGVGWHGARVGRLNVASTSAFAASGPYHLTVVTTLGQAPYASPASITCTGKTSTTFTGCGTTAGGGMLSTGNAVSGPLPTIALPSGSQVGDTAIGLAEGGNTSLYPTGWTALGTNNNNSGADSRASTHVLTAADITAGSVAFQSGNYAMVAVYRNVAALGTVKCEQSGKQSELGM